MWANSVKHSQFHFFSLSGVFSILPIGFLTFLLLETMPLFHIFMFTILVYFATQARIFLAYTVTFSYSFINVIFKIYLIYYLTGSLSL